MFSPGYKMPLPLSCKWCGNKFEVNVEMNQSLYTDNDFKNALNDKWCTFICPSCGKAFIQPYLSVFYSKCRPCVNLHFVSNEREKNVFSEAIHNKFLLNPSLEATCRKRIIDDLETLHEKLTILSTGVFGPGDKEIELYKVIVQDFYLEEGYESVVGKFKIIDNRYGVEVYINGKKEFVQMYDDILKVLHKSDVWRYDNDPGTIIVDEEWAKTYIYTHPEIWNEVMCEIEKIITEKGYYNYSINS